MENCNCNLCGESICDDECTCLPSDHTTLGCIPNLTECVTYNGPNIPASNITKNQDLNVVIKNLTDKISELTILINNLGSPCANCIYTDKISLTSTQIKELNTSPVTLIAAKGANTFIQPMTVFIKFNAGTIPYEIPWDVNLPITISTPTSEDLATFFNVINGNVDSNFYSNIAAGVPIPLVNTDIILKVKDSNPLNGDGTIDVYITYTVVTL